ncbi:MAG: hypothetical protein GQ525_09665 [Draconibacterium sp.]|nr:hypothetical protein [Draconibacterium sp.]
MAFIKFYVFKITDIIRHENGFGLPGILLPAGFQGGVALLLPEGWLFCCYGVLFIKNDLMICVY